MQNENNLVNARYGYVSDYDPEKHAARVRFPDMDDLVSGWLPVGTRNTKENFYEAGLDIDEHVFCLLLGNGTEEGIILCSLYDDTNPPLKKDLNEQRIKFKDETEIFYNRETNELKAINKTGSYIYMREGEIEIHGVESIKLTDDAGDYIKLHGGQIEVHGVNHVNTTAARIDHN